MRKKTKGFTLIELIIVMGLTLIIMSAAYSFLATSNKTTINEDLKSTLQSEGNIIENKILTIGTQATKATSIKTEAGDIVNYKINAANLQSDGTFELSELTLEDYEKTAYTIKLQDNELIIISSDNTVQTLSKNVVEFRAQPLNINQYTEADKNSKYMNEITGYKLSFKLEAKKGVNEANYDISVQVTFRNYDVEISAPKQVFNKFETIITNVWNKSEGLVEISDASKNSIINNNISVYGDNSIDITELQLKQYDGSLTKIEFSESEKTLSVITDQGILKKFDNIVNMKIKVIDSQIDNKTLKEASGFKIIITLDENGIKSTYELLVKFKTN